VVARVPARSRVLFPPSSGELEGNGPGARAACTSNPSLFVVVFTVSPCCKGIFDVAIDDFRMLQ
jgi:hypothetical protein